MTDVGENGILLHHGNVVATDNVCCVISRDKREGEVKERGEGGEGGGDG